MIIIEIMIINGNNDNHEINGYKWYSTFYVLWNDKIYLNGVCIKIWFEYLL